MEKFRGGQVIGVKDNMALVGILSTQLLIHYFDHVPRGEVRAWSRSVRDDVRQFVID